MSVVLTPAHRDAIIDEIDFTFESAGGLTFLLDQAPGSQRDRDHARHLVTRLQVTVAVLDQLDWERKGDRECYVLEVDEAVDEFAAEMERVARAGLEYNRAGLVAGDERVRASTQRLIDADLEKLRAARVIRTAFKIARDLDAFVASARSPRQSSKPSRPKHFRRA